MKTEIVDRQQLKAFMKVASSEQLQELALMGIDSLEETVGLMGKALCFSRWLFVTQFALWCVWLA